MIFAICNAAALWRAAVEGKGWSGSPSWVARVIERALAAPGVTQCRLSSVGVPPCFESRSEAHPVAYNR